MISLGLFDIMQVDPLDQADHAEVYQRRRRLWRLADELGFDVGFIAERHYQLHYRTPAPSLWLASVAEQTKKMRLGVLAYTLPLHSPVGLAEEVAVLDQLSGGRLEVGIGLGHRVEELIANGIDPAQRITIFQERLAVMEGLWSGGQVSFESPHTTVRQVAISPLPVQNPAPPLWYAGTDRNAATWAGSHGMSLAVGFAPPSALQPATHAFKVGQEVRRNTPDGAVKQPREGRISLMQHVYIAESDDRAFAEMREDLERLTALNPQGQAMTPGERKDHARADLDKLLQNEMFLAGGPERVANGIRKAQETLGLDLFLANFFGAGIGDDRVERSMRYLQSEVRSLLA